MEGKIVKATIITIGDELLIGQVIDTNSAWIAKKLNEAGIWLHRRVSIGDVKEQITETLKEESKHTDIIIITGGLGPTADDITKPVLCEYFGGKLVTDNKVLEHIQSIFEKRKLPFTERNAKQAELPDVCTVLHNPVGTAPGMLFEKNNKLYFSLPGVPMEMQVIMEDHVLPILKKKTTDSVILHRTLVTSGIGESFLADLIQDWEETLPDYIKLAYLPSFGLIRLRLTGKHRDEQILEKELSDNFRTLKELVKDYLIIEEDLTLPEYISKIMKDRNITLGTVESCTGGNIARSITVLPGASAFYMGSVIAYDNKVKTEILGVKSTTLQSHGAVSEATVQEMVSGGLRSLKTDYIIATTGIMGPEGGSAEKPVGTVWIGIGNHRKMISKKYNFPYNREKNILMVTNTALNMLRKMILEEES